MRGDSSEGGSATLASGVCRLHFGRPRFETHRERGARAGRRSRVAAGRRDGVQPAAAVAEPVDVAPFLGPTQRDERMPGNPWPAFRRGHRWDLRLSAMTSMANGRKDGVLRSLAAAGLRKQIGGAPRRPDVNAANSRGGVPFDTRSGKGRGSMLCPGTVYGEVSRRFCQADTCMLADNPMCPPLKRHPSAWQTVLRHSRSPLADLGLSGAMAFGWQIQRRPP